MTEGIVNIGGRLKKGGSPTGAADATSGVLIQIRGTWSLPESMSFSGGICHCNDGSHAHRRSA